MLATHFQPSYFVPVELKNIPDGNYWVKVLDDHCTDDPSPNKPYECYVYTDGVRGIKLDESQHECKVICKPGGVGFKARHRMPLVSKNTNYCRSQASIYFRNCGSSSIYKEMPFN